MLFEEQPEANLRSCIQMVEAVLVDLGHDARRARLVPAAEQGPNVVAAWGIHKGSAEVIITVARETGASYLRAASTVALLPEGDARAPLLARLLEMNAGEVRGAAFGVREDAVVLAAERSILDLDPTEVLDIVQRVESYADRFDDQLIAEFGARPPT